MRTGYNVFGSVLLLLIRVPLVLLVQFLDRIGRQQVFLVHGIDIHTNMLTHEPHAEGMSEAPDFEGFSGHGAMTMDVNKDCMIWKVIVYVRVDHVRVADDGGDF